MAILIRDELGEVYPHHAWDFARALGVFSRYPLTQVQSPLLEYDDMRVQVVRVQMQERSLLLYNCHPFSMKTILELLPTDTSLEDVVANNFYSRTSFMQRLAADLDTQTGPVVVAGDLNSTDQSDAYALLQSRLTNAHQAAGWGLGHTFPADGTRHIGGTSIPARLMRLDMIFYSDELVALDSYVSATHGASDHMPVLATLAWRSPYSP
jgi:endonuclease/exonuclease/phosphatase (EEP) superfamily protein YafD